MNAFIDNSAKTPDQLLDVFKQMDDGTLLAQDLVQQGAINALSSLLSLGCSEEMVGEMLQGLKFSSQAIRAEAIRRGKPSLFVSDQTNLNG